MGVGLEDSKPSKEIITLERAEFTGMGHLPAIWNSVSSLVQTVCSMKGYSEPGLKDDLQ